MAAATSLVVFSEVTDSPTLKMCLPVPLPIGTKLVVCQKVHRRVGPRTEAFSAVGTFRVDNVLVDVRGPVPRQTVFLSALGVVPGWKAVKTPPQPKPRVLPPAKSPPTEIT